MGETEILQMLSRLKSSMEGIEFIEYLTSLSSDNYKAWKVDSTEMNDIHKGYALAYDNLLHSFENCERLLARIQKSEQQAKDETLAQEHY